MKKIVYPLVLIFGFILFVYFYQPVCSTDSEIDKDKVNLLLSWLIKEKQAQSLYPIPVIPSPTVRLYSKVSLKERIAICGNLCSSEDPKIQLNMFLDKVNEIWVRDDAREDLIIHEQRHALQFAEDNNIDQTSDAVEDDAVFWQHEYEKKFGKHALCNNGIWFK